MRHKHKEICNDVHSAQGIANEVRESALRECLLVSRLSDLNIVYTGGNRWRRSSPRKLPIAGLWNVRLLLRRREDGQANAREHMAEESTNIYRHRLLFA